MAHSRWSWFTMKTTPLARRRGQAFSNTSSVLQRVRPHSMLGYLSPVNYEVAQAK